MANDYAFLGTYRSSLRGVDVAAARSLAPMVAQEIRDTCCSFSQGDLSAGSTTCYPEDWPVTTPEGVHEEGYQAGRAFAAGTCARYNRGLVEGFQEAAGLDPDGDYGPATVGALRHFGVRNPPAAVFGRGEVPYVIAESAPEVIQVAEGGTGALWGLGVSIVAIGALWAWSR